MDHSTTSPLEGSLTSTCSQVCGLVHWNSLIVPTSVFVCCSSKVANEWCAYGAPETRAARIAAAALTRVFMSYLSVSHGVFEASLSEQTSSGISYPVSLL